jgi:hypothetical protein
MPSKLQVANAVAFFSQRTNQELVAKMEGHENSITNFENMKRKPRGLNASTSQSKHIADVIYEVLDHRDYF